MRPNPDSGPSKNASLLEILDDLVPAELHAAAWARCAGAGWHYGHGSNPGDGSAFWRMDLESDPAFDGIWEHMRPRCEALAGAPLRVLRQYANGHTYGLGGRPHKDDGEFTLLYYPNPEWKDDWEGETVFSDPTGEIYFSVRPRPNRCVFFDAGTLHAGRAPSRVCPALRVTVAYKLERMSSAPAAPVTKRAIDPGDKSSVERISVDGSTHVYSFRIPAALIDRGVGERLAKLSHSVSLPGFRPGNVPAAVLQTRYGAQVRADVLNALATEAIDRGLPRDSVASGLELKRGADSGDVEIHVTATHIPTLPALDFSALELEQLRADKAALDFAQVTAEQAAEHFRGYLKAQVLDRLDAAYRFPILPALVDREFSQVWQAAQAQAEIPVDAEAYASIELRAIAERRLRLGSVVAELARRTGIRSASGAELEEKVIDDLITKARVRQRTVAGPELREMMEN
jgi:hypothetical protein